MVSKLYIASVPMRMTTERIAPVLLGADAPEAPALVAGDDVMSYARLTAAVHRRADELDLAPRSLVVLEASNTVDASSTNSNFGSSAEIRQLCKYPRQGN